MREGLVLRAVDHLPDPPVRPSESTRTNTRSWLGLTVDEEMAALISLILGIRLRSGGLTREFGTDDPAGRPIAFMHKPPSWRAPRASNLPTLIRATVSLDTLPPILQRLPLVNAAESVALIRAARHYQTAVWVADDDPELAWLQLVSAAEVAASQYAGTNATPVEALEEGLPDVTEVLRRAGGNDLVREVSPLLAHLVKSTFRFVQFMMTFAPGPPDERPSFEWARLPWNDLERRLRLVYKYRSSCLHEGTPFPGPLSVPPMKIGGELLEIPPGEVSFFGPTQWASRDLPMYLWVFERIVRGALLSWYERHLGKRSD
jgi:hypothetical protein